MTEITEAPPNNEEVFVSAHEMVEKDSKAVSEKNDESNAGQSVPPQEKSKSDSSSKGDSSTQVALPTDTGELAEESGLKDTHRRYQKVLRKMDLYFLWFLPLLYLFCFLNRVNIGHAKAYDLKKYLNLSDTEYSLCLALFFIGYVLFEVPSNMIMKQVGPRIWIPVLMLGWGGISLGMGFVTNFEQLLALRILLGIPQAGLFPGIIYYMAGWYTKTHRTSRISIFFTAASLAGGLGGLLAYAINGLDGRHGLAGWQWIFIIEAIPTLFFGIMTYFYLPDSPETARFLTAEEKKLMRQQFAAVETSGSSFDIAADADSRTGMRVFLDVIKRPITVPFMLMNFLCLLPVYALSYALPTIIRGLGYSGPTAQLLSAPPYLIATVVSVITALDADKRGEVWGHISISGVGSAIGFLILATCTAYPTVSYIFTYLCTCSVFAILPLVIAWASRLYKNPRNNAIAIALISSFGNMGGVLGGFMYSSPGVYARDHWIVFGSAILLLCTSVGMHYYLKQRREWKKSLRDLRAAQ